MAGDDDETPGDELDGGAQERIAAIAAEGDQAEEAAREEELEGKARREYPYDRELAGALEILNAGLFALAAGRRGPHWRLTEQENQDLAKAQAQCVERYVGSVALGPAVTLVFTSAAIVAPRLNEDARLVREHAQRQQQAEGQEEGEA